VAHILLSGRFKSNIFSPFFRHSCSIAQKPRNQAVLKAKRLNYQQRKADTGRESSAEKTRVLADLSKKKDGKARNERIAREIEKQRRQPGGRRERPRS